MKLRGWTSGVGALALGLLVGACTVENADPPRDASNPPPATQSQAAGGDCQSQKDACVTRCKQAAPDEASRQPCYNDCMRQSAACGG